MDEATLKAAFDSADSNRNGSIDEAEFGALVASLATGLSDTEVLTAFRAIDVNGNGRIEFSEFAGWWKQR